MTEDIYKTILTPCEGVYKEKGSKFLCFLYPVSSVDEVKLLVDKAKSDFYDARHVCYAYRLGREGDVWRTVDDGEPSGTAGKPILGQLLSFEITNVLAIVVRYFGGTKLGVSGLIQAYKSATEDAIGNAEIIEKTVDKEVEMEFHYNQTSAVMQVVKGFGVKVKSQEFDNKSTVVVVVRERDCERFCEQVGKVEGVNIKINQIL